ncbi:hypothetical protein SAMD00019534_083910 [Acytostelium subglobosum LB1]|uniref:hypothetical protein n=1 Tax=Acytostelium subglobosum LB1 TaxID=1410327 RepID=UPI000644D54C|nr:hypothetical protein SAMD00019534_083910 [Acytostelium subglobosum LB1]GAM25216.1 hypothetical protein SAMD00019534_083910 [Acytostelium subglobosum LB1]|eukprot:XP_012751736.1 hypothetical protein SAMD00019534_083910 [Acytostelium subglobosum LB1]
MEGSFGLANIEAVGSIDLASIEAVGSFGLANIEAVGSVDLANIETGGSFAGPNIEELGLSLTFENIEPNADLGDDGDALSVVWENNEGVAVANNDGRSNRDDVFGCSSDFVQLGRRSIGEDLTGAEMEKEEEELDASLVFVSTEESFELTGTSVDGIVVVADAAAVVAVVVSVVVVGACVASFAFTSSAALLFWMVSNLISSIDLSLKFSIAEMFLMMTLFPLSSVSL